MKQLQTFFNDDSSDEFEGFMPEDLFMNPNIFANLPISDFSPENDGDFPNDVQNGWSKIDSDHGCCKGPFHWGI